MLVQTNFNLPAGLARPIVEAPSGKDRRSGGRLNLALPLVLTRRGQRDPIQTKTENVSCNSFYCISDRPLFPDEVVDCELVIPGTDITSVPEPDLHLTCSARVVRVVGGHPNGGYGVACQLEDYTVTRSSV